MAKKKTPPQEVALEVVCNLGRAVAAEMDLPSLLELIYQETGRVMDTDCFTMGLYDPLEDGLRFELVYDKGARLDTMILRRQDGWGLAGRVFEERAALLLDDVQAGKLPVGAIPLGDVPRSWLGVPLIARERAIGVVSVQSYEADAFSPADQHILEAIASQAAVAIENLFLRREHERRIAELSALNEIGQAIITAKHTEDILEAIYRQTSRVMDTSNLYVSLYDPGQELITFDYFMEDGARVSTEPLKLSDGGLTVRIVTTRQPLLLGENLEREAAELGIDVVGRPALSYLGVPMLSGDHVVGVIAVQSPNRRRAYDRRHQDLLANIANLAAVAIENSRLSREQEQRMTEMSILNEVSRGLSSAIGLDQLLELIQQQVSRTFDTTNFYISLYDQETDEWRTALHYEHGERHPELRRKGGEGLTGHIIRTRQPLLLRSVEENIAFDEAHGITTIGQRPLSWMGVPMIVADKLVGVMAIQSYEHEYFYDVHDQTLFSTLAAQAAVAVDNARLLRDHERRIAELSAVAEVSRAVSSAVALDELLKTVEQQVGRLFDTTNFHIGTYSEETDEWMLAFSRERGQADARVGTRYKVGAGLTGHIIRYREAVFLPTVAENDAFHEREGIPSIGERSQSWMGVPLLAADKVVGVMAIQSYEQENLYSRQDLALFSTIGSQVAAAIEKARLFQQLEGQLADVIVVNDVSQAILRAESEDELLEAIHGQVGRVMDTTNFYVALYNEARQELAFSYYVEEGERRSGATQTLSGGGLTAHIVRERQPLFLESNMDEQLQALGIAGRGRPARSYLGVPMVAGDQVVGAMAVQSYTQERAFTQRHLALFTSISTQAALALQRIRLRGSESRKARMLSLIGDVSRKVTAILDLDELLRELARSIQLGFGHANVAVFRVDEESKELALGALVGRYAGIMDWGFRQPMKEGLLGWAVQNNKTLVCGNVTEDPRYIRGFDAEELTLSEMCVPITYANRVIGVLDIQSESESAFDQEDVSAMETLAGQLAAAMRNAVLFRERGEQLASLNALNRVIQATAVTFTLDDLLTALCDVVTEMMSPDGFFVALFDKAREHLIAPFVMDEGVFYRNTELSRKGFTEHMLRTGKPVFIRNMTQEADRYPVERSTMGSGKAAASWLGVPLRSGEEIIGALVVQSYRNYAFDDSDLNFIEATASQIVVSIERARLFEETQRTLQELREANEQQRRLFGIVRELSTPLVPVTEGILVLPLVGTIDSQRAQQIMDVLLSGITDRRAKVVILDITGVPVVDTSVANYLLQATQAVRLLGSECILVGITPEVAQTVVGLGVDLHGLVTRSDLQGGIEYALKLLGRRIVKPARRVSLPGEKPAGREEGTPPPAPRGP